MCLSIEHRVEQFKRYYARCNDRPLFGFSVGGQYPLRFSQAAKHLPTDRALRPDDIVPEHFFPEYDQQFEAHERCGGDLIWAADSFWPIPWLEAALGCPIRVNVAAGSIIAEPHPDPDGAARSMHFDERDPWIACALRFTEALAQHSGGRYPLAQTRMRGISDLLAALDGNERFIFRLIDEPDRAHDLVRRLTDIWIGFAAAQLKRIPPFHGGIGTYFFGLWAPLGTVWLQEDSAALLNPSLFADFILPQDQRIISAFPHSIFHLHPTKHFPYRELLDTDLLAIELHVDTGGPSVRKLTPIYKEILASKPLLIWGEIAQDNLEYLVGTLPAQGLAVNVAVDNVDEARRIRANISRSMADLNPRFRSVAK